MLAVWHKNGFGQEARDVFLWPQKQTRFTPEGRKVKNWRKVFQIKSRGALFRFYLTLICRNTIKSKQDPGAVKSW